MASDPPPSVPATSEATTLQQAISDGAVDCEQAVSLIVSLCEKVSQAHEDGQSYGRLCPTVITIADDLTLTITITPKGGLLEEELDKDATKYAAPEVVSGAECSARSDVYSIACILYRLLTGSPLESASSPPPSRVCGSPLVLDTIIKRATCAKPHDRISSAQKLANDLRQTAQSRPTIKGPEAPITPIRKHIVSAAPLRVQTEQTRPVIPWSLVLKSALALAMLGLVVKVASQFGREVEGDMSSGPQTSRQSRELTQRPDPFAQTPVKGQTKTDLRLSSRSKSAPRERLKDSLNRLKSALASGNRSELPEGSVRRNDSSYALWERTMTWPEARKFAEDHGAHLAILKDRKDRDWARERFDMRYPAWVGAGKGANDNWYWLDGTPLPAGRSVGDKEQWHLALNANGILMPADAERKCDLLLEWRDDGENPGTEKEQLKRVRTLALSGAREKLLEGEGLPVGTRTYETSHFYALRSPMLRWGEALDLAATLGAYLAVPSNADEHRWISSNFWEYLGTGQGLWIGGFREGAKQPWRWISREPWHGAGLIEGGNPHPLFDRILLQGGGAPGTSRWTMVEGVRRKAPGILFEWSTVGTDVSDKPVTRFDMEGWLDGINRKTQQLTGSDLSAFAWSKRKIVEQYNRELTKEIRERKSVLRSGVRRPGQDPAGSQGILAELSALESSLAEAVASGQLLPAVPLEEDALRNTHKQATNALTALEEKYDRRIKALQESYRGQIEARAIALLEEGHLEKASALRTVLRSLKPDLKAFLRLLYPQNVDRAKLPWPPREATPAEDH